LRKSQTSYIFTSVNVVVHPKIKTIENLLLTFNVIVNTNTNFTTVLK